MPPATTAGNVGKGMLTNALSLMLLFGATGVSYLAPASDSGPEISLSAPEAAPMHGRGHASARRGGWSGERA